MQLDLGNLDFTGHFRTCIALWPVDLVDSAVDLDESGTSGLGAIFGVDDCRLICMCALVSSVCSWNVSTEHHNNG